MTFTLVLLAALVQAAPEPTAPSGLPPEQALASIDAKDNLTITHVTCYAVPGMWGNILPYLEKGPDKGAVKAKVKVTNLMMTTAELPVKHVEAYTANGRPITAEKLRTLLAKERTVLVMLDGKKPDSFYFYCNPFSWSHSRRRDSLTRGGPLGGVSIPVCAPYHFSGR